MTRLGTDRGFSLVELLIALAILGLVVATLTIAFSFAQRSFELMSGSAYQLNDINSARRLLDDALSQLSDDPQLHDGTHFIGTPTGFTVVAIGPRIFGAAGPMTLGVEAAPNGGLEFTWKKHGEASLQRRKLASEYRALFAYYSISTDWISGWDRIESDPALVRIDFVRRGREETGLALTIPVKRVSPAICAIRPAIKGCANT